MAKRTDPGNQLLATVHNLRAAPRESWARWLARNESEVKPKGDGLTSLSFPMLIVGELPVLRPEGKQSLGERLAADRRHLRPGQDEGCRAASTMRSRGRHGRSSTQSPVGAGVWGNLVSPDPHPLGGPRHPRNNLS